MSNAPVDNAKNVNVMMSVHSLLEHSDNYFDTSTVYGNIAEMSKIIK